MQSFLHSPEWETFQKSVGHSPIRHEEYLYEVQKVPFFTYYLGSRIDFSPMSTLPPVPKSTTFFRLEPTDKRALTNLLHSTHKKLVSTTAVQPRQTSLVDLAKSEDQLLAAMHQKHRYNIRLAEKKGVEVSIYSQDAETQFPRFWKLMNTTAKRQGFRTHEATYYQKMLHYLAPTLKAHLLFATHEGDDLATMLLITHDKTATYLHGASSEEKKNLMAPFLLHAKAMRFARTLTCEVYDFWGLAAVMNEETGEWEPQEGHTSAGVTRFKLGFGGTIMEYPGTFDLILRPFWYSLYKGIRRLRSRKRAFS